ncbi:hypothetical protein J2T17_007133 [Paenibacillus mucilaginosus]|uniref:stalk domain-containing protein n=1 Tax=Paenibacillus mucilaginosus TaxID=61624 RepID=UPI003D1F0396
MKSFKTIRDMAAGMVIGTLVFGGAAYAADAIKLDAFYGVKLMQNGVDKTPAENKPFIANGSTYVPLRAVGELLGVPVSWDGENSAVVIGEKVDGVLIQAPTRISSVDDDGNIRPASDSASIETNAEAQINGKIYSTQGFSLESDQYAFINATLLGFDLNNQYKTLSFSIGMDDSYAALRTITITDQDGNVLKELVLGKGTLLEGIKVDVSGVTELKVNVDGNGSNSTIHFISPILSK